MQRALLLCVILVVLAGGQVAAQCKPTPGYALDAFYAPSAPKRASVGSGFFLTGTVRGTLDCLPIERATVEYWLSGPSGYTDKLRGTVVADKNGRYRFQCPFPVSQGGAPHIHLNVAADGYIAIQTEVFPSKAKASGEFDIVLELGD